MNEQTESRSVIKGETSHWDSLIGTLPFVLFGIASMIGKIRVPFWGIYADLAFYARVLWFSRTTSPGLVFVGPKNHCDIRSLDCDIVLASADRFGAAFPPFRLT